MQPVLKRRPPRVVRWMAALGGTLLAGAAFIGFVGTCERIVRADGVVRPRGDLVRIPSRSEGIVSRVWVYSGQEVREGTVLVELDHQQVLDRIEAARRSLDRSRRELEALQELVDTTSAQGKIAVARLALEVAVAEELVEGESRRLRREQELGRSDLRMAERETRALEEDLARKQELSNQGFVSKEEVRQLALALDRVRAQRDRVRILAAGDPGPLRLAEKRLAVARKSLESHEMELKVRLHELQLKMAEEAESQDRWRATLADLEAARERAFVRAPAAGHVIWVLAAHPGEWLQEGATAAHLVPHRAPLVIHADVPNGSIGTVRPGQDARIEIVAFPAQQHGYFQGKVADVAWDAAENLKNGRMYRVTIELDSSRPPTAPLRLGMDARVQIITGHQKIVELLTGAP